MEPVSNFNPPIVNDQFLQKFVYIVSDCMRIRGTHILNEKMILELMISLFGNEYAAERFDPNKFFYYQRRYNLETFKQLAKFFLREVEISRLSYCEYCSPNYIVVSNRTNFGIIISCLHCKPLKTIAATFRASIFSQVMKLDCCEIMTNYPACCCTLVVGNPFADVDMARDTILALYDVLSAPEEYKDYATQKYNEIIRSVANEIGKRERDVRIRLARGDAKDPDSIKLKQLFVKQLSEFSENIKRKLEEYQANKPDSKELEEEIKKDLYVLKVLMMIYYGTLPKYANSRGDLSQELNSVQSAINEYLKKST